MLTETTVENKKAILNKFEELLQKKLVSLVDRPDKTYPNEIFTNEVKKTYDWCRLHGIFHSWHLHELFQLYEPGKNVIARVVVSLAMLAEMCDGISTVGKTETFFLVPLDLVEKALLLGEIPD